MLANRMLMCLNKRKIDCSTPTTVVNSSYITSATARPQRLSNGWWVICVYDSTNSQLKFFVSKDNGVTFNQLCYSSAGGVNYFTMASYGTMIYFDFEFASASTQGHFGKFDATTVTNTNQTTTAPLTTVVTAISGVHLATSTIGTITLAISVKNATYPNSFNIRSAKSTDGGITWTKQDGTAGVDQLTADNISGKDNTCPYVQYNKNDKPIIVYQLLNGSNGAIESYYFTTSWVFSMIYHCNNYTQSNPILTLQKYGTNAGRIWVTWHGADGSAPSTQNIGVTYSDDNGVTWSSMTKLTNETTNGRNQMYPTIVTDKNNNADVIFTGLVETGATYIQQIRKFHFNGTSWSSLTNLTSENSAQNFPSVCDNYYDYINPIVIWQDNANNRVAFEGVFNV